MDTGSRQIDLIWDSDEDQPPNLKLESFLNALFDRVELNSVELSILITHDQKMAELNSQFRHKDRTTDVLSFPSSTGAFSDITHMGDIVISIDQARKQATEIGQSLVQELYFLSLHGVLHLMGYDHETDQGEMLSYQNQLKTELAAYF